MLVRVTIQISTWFECDSLEKSTTTFLTICDLNFNLVSCREYLLSGWRNSVVLNTSFHLNSSMPQSLLHADVSVVSNSFSNFDHISIYEIIIDWGRRRCARLIVCKWRTYKSISLFQIFEPITQRIDYRRVIETSNSTSRNQSRNNQTTHNRKICLHTFF